MFRGSAWTGLLIIIGIFAGCYLEAPYGEHMPVVAWGALAGLIVSTATGYIFESKTDGDQGLWDSTAYLWDVRYSLSSTTQCGRGLP